MQEIRIEARGKGGAIGIKAVSRLANMVNSLKALQNAAGSVRQVHTDYRVLQMLP